MVALAKFIGVFLAVTGIVLMVKPAAIKKLIGYWEEDNRVYILAVIRIIAGIIILLAARSAMIPWIVVVVGLVPLISGGVIFVVGAGKCKEMMAKFKAKPNTFFRKVAIVPLALGLLLLWAI